jgi:hypothetical protein
MPDGDSIPALLAEQLGPLLTQAKSDGPGWEELIELFEVLDAEGAHVFDMHLFCGDDGRVHRAGTLAHVASFSQGGPAGTADPRIEQALADALARWRAEHKPER